MIRKSLIVLLLTALPTLAWSHTCPAYVEMINDSLAMADEMGLDDETVEEIETLRDKGKTHHEQGEHDRAIAALDQALALIEQGG